MGLSLDLLERMVAKEGELGWVRKHLERLLVADSESDPPLDVARSSLILSLCERGREGVQGIPVTRKLQRVVLLDAPTHVTYVDDAMLARWGIGRADAEEIASANNDRRLEQYSLSGKLSTMAGTEPELASGMLRIHGPEPVVAALLSPGLREWSHRRSAGFLGWPVYAVAPARDSVALFPAHTLDSVLDKAGRFVREMLATQPHTLGGELLHISDDGLRQAAR